MGLVTKCAPLHTEKPLTVKSSADPIARAKQPAYRRVFDGLRAQILSGKLAPGTQLASTRELVVTWHSSYRILHIVLTELAREGWLERSHGSGTFIADPTSRFSCAGIYHGSDIGFQPEQAFARSLHFSLIKGFERLKKDTQVFFDSRPKKEQGTILPALADAIRHRRIQCLIAPTLNKFNPPPLTRLVIPTAFLTNPLSSHRVDYDLKAILQESMARLKAQGCRSVGLISNMPQHCYELFEQTGHEAGLVMRKEWLRQSNHSILNLESYGYREFKEIWSLSKKPDGIFVYPDSAVRGVVLAILEAGISAASKSMKFVFHKNVHVPILCPFTATWAITSEDAMAHGLIELIQKQFRREEITPLLIPCHFKEGDMLK
jgi:hypothetical protein